jgi:hypothetical protein
LVSEISDDFMMRYAMLRGELYMLLGLTDISESDHTLMLNRFLSDIIKYGLSGREQGGRDLMAKGRTLVQTLELVKKHDSAAFSTYRDKLITADRMEKFVGAWFELRTYRLLVETGIPFEIIPEIKTPAPDFVVHFEGSDLFVECASLHLATDKPGDLMYKFRPAVEHKNEKSYSGPNTALFVESMMIYSQNQDRGIPIEEPVKKKAEQLIREIKFGNLSLFYDAVDPPEATDRKLTTLHLRSDSATINDKLKRFLDLYFVPS